MSDTKFEKSEELISRLDIDPEKFTPNSSQCSCLNCDSIGCFTKRNKAIKARCKCNICSGLKTCSTINTKDSREIKAELVPATKKVVKEVVTRETVESLKRVTETMYEFGNKENISMLMEGQTILSNNKVIPKPPKVQTPDIKECCKKRVFGSRQTSDTKKCKQNLTSECGNIKKGHSDQSTVSQGHSDKREYCKKNVCSNSKIRESKECCKQNVFPQSENKKLDHPNTKSLISQRHIGDKKDFCKETPITKVASKDKLSQPDKLDNTATKLSAQVMNVPYEDINESTRSSHELIHDSPQTPISKLNIFKRIKEIYEACSCKVCECISSKPRFTENTCDFRIDGHCKCKPCECKECVKLRKKIEEKIKRIPHSGCPCIRCDRNDCKGVVKKNYEQQVCDCNPSDSTQYLVNLSKPCSCKPCQCINCTSIEYRVPKVVKLGQVNEITQGETCKCAPCECIECKHNIYNRTNPTIMCTTSTAMPHRNYCLCDDCRSVRCHDDTETCKCEKHNKSIRKSFEKNYNNYDIRTVIVDNNSPFNKHNQSPFGQQNTVALLTYYGRNSCNDDICNCTECECIVCTARDNKMKSREHLRSIMPVHNNMKLPMPIMNACRCSPCECEICYKKYEGIDDAALESNCKCEVCDCLNCDNAPLANSAFLTSSLPTSSFTPHNISKGQHTKTIRRMDMNNNCDCNPCNCRDCKKLFSCSSTVKFYSNGKVVQKQSSRRVRKVMLITPSSSEAHIKLQKPSMGSISSKNLGPKASIEGLFRQDLSTCHALSNNCATMNSLSKTNKHQDSHSYEDIKERNIPSDNDVETEMFYDLSNPILETVSFKSMDEASILNYSCDLPQASSKGKNVCNISHNNKNKAKFNVIHEPLDNISSNYSDESLPVFWTCHNEMSYPINCPRNLRINCKTDKCRLKNLSLNLNKSKDNEQVMQSRYDGNYNHNNDDELKDSGKSIIYQSVQPSYINIDYERAVRVLGEAKAFSSKLIQMLDSFETANKQFESASQKFKNLHESLLDINESGANKIYSTEIDTDPKPIFEDSFEIKSEDAHIDTTLADVRVKDENQAEKEYEQSTAILPKSNDFLELMSETFENCKADINMIAKTDLNSQYNEVNPISINHCNIQKETNLLQKSLDLPLNKSVESLSHIESPLVSDFNNLDMNQDLIHRKANNEIKNKSNTNIIKQYLPASVKTKLDSVFDNTSNVHTNVVTEKKLEDLYKQGDNQPWKILNKNLYLNAHPTNKRPIFEFPPLELDVKKAIQAISLQAGNNENLTRIVPRPNEALANLKSEVNNLLNMPLLQTTSKSQREIDSFKYFSSRSKMDLERKSTSFASSQTYEPTKARADKAVYSKVNVEEKRSSWNQLKVNFVELRRVSDHTVLVKWDGPKRIQDVQGYELLVDGRAVQAFGASRRMAVVTCLPHAARVLLTVRTLPAARCAHAHRHAPAATVVYRPRK